MRGYVRFAAVAALLAVGLAGLGGCIVVHDDDGYYHRHHHWDRDDWGRRGDRH